MGAGSFEPLMRDALMGLERVYALDADEAIEAREGRLTEKDETIRRLNGEIGRLEEELEELETEKAAYEEQIEELGTENAAYEAEIEKRTAEAGESEQELNAKLASLEQSVAEKEERIGELEEEIASLREAADEAEPAGAEAVEEGDDEKDEQIRRLEAELAEKEYQLESMSGTVSTEELERRVAAAREQSFQEVLDAIAYVTGGSTPSTKEEVEERVDRDPMYRNVFEEIKKIAEQEVEVTERVRVIESKLLGTISSVTAGRVIIEPLIDLEVEEGTKILIKRRTSSGEIPIAEGRVDEVTMGRIAARIEKRISTTRNPIVMDLVYLQIEGTEE
jgi:chromosome segregation ATPase